MKFALSFVNKFAHVIVAVLQIHLFDARMLAPLVRFLEQNGARSERFLDRARIPGELIEAGGWIGKKQAYDFTFDIVQRSRCPQAVFTARPTGDKRKTRPPRTNPFLSKVKESQATG